MKNVVISFLLISLVIIAGCSSITPDNNNLLIDSFEKCVEAGNPVMESYPRKCSAGGETYVEELGLANECEINGGTWIESAQECEGITENICTQLNGTFNECGSACRNNPNASVCTLQCVQYCAFN